MRILVDEDIPFAREAFSGLGTVTTLAPPAFPDAVGAADALVVRSTRKVDAALLDGTPVRFVGTATAGTDHVDVDYLARRGVVFAAAPGCNAESVAQYVATALAALRIRCGFTVAGKSIGIVGVGQCGSRVERIATALGMTPVLCDPPRGRATGSDRFRPLAELAHCDVVTLHVPRTLDGPDRTEGMIDAAFLRALRPDAVLLNCCRGEVLDEEALVTALRSDRLAAAVIDVWAGEPAIDPVLLATATLTTSHIAGYSYDGKVNGTAMMHEALCRFAGVAPHWDAAAVLAAAPRVVDLPAGDGTADGAIAALLLDAYAIEADVARLQAFRDVTPEARAAGFRMLRKTYPLRREFASTQVRSAGVESGVRERLRQIGFGLAGA